MIPEKRLFRSARLVDYTTSPCLLEHIAPTLDRLSDLPDKRPFCLGAPASRRQWSRQYIRNLHVFGPAYADWQRMRRWRWW